MIAPVHNMLVATVKNLVELPILYLELEVQISLFVEFEGFKSTN